MKKNLLGLLTLLLCFTLIGCTSKKEEPKKEEVKKIEISQEEQEFIDNKYSTDEKTLVLKKDNSYVVYELDGDTILSSKTYIDYIVPAKAAEEYEKHKDEKGLIHTNSYKCQHFINNNLINSRLISHNSDNREGILNYFEKDENPLVLVSPSMSEGVDLPYDKCRFQVIYKIPFPYLGDKQINMRRKNDQKWYAYKTVMTLMQAYGRGMRAEDDYCYTYILDSDINMVLKSPIYRSLVPDFFKEALVRVKK